MGVQGTPCRPRPDLAKLYRIRDYNCRHRGPRKWWGSRLRRTTQSIKRTPLTTTFVFPPRGNSAWKSWSYTRPCSPERRGLTRVGMANMGILAQCQAMKGLHPGKVPRAPPTPPHRRHGLTQHRDGQHGNTGAMPGHEGTPSRKGTMRAGGVPIQTTRFDPRRDGQHGNPGTVPGHEGTPSRKGTKCAERQN